MRVRQEIGSAPGERKLVQDHPLDVLPMQLLVHVNAKPILGSLEDDAASWDLFIL
jgi:hypothetical protein